MASKRTRPDLKNLDEVVHYLIHEFGVYRTLQELADTCGARAECLARSDSNESVYYDEVAAEIDTLLTKIGSDEDGEESW